MPTLAPPIGDPISHNILLPGSQSDRIENNIDAEYKLMLTYFPGSDMVAKVSNIDKQ